MAGLGYKDFTAGAVLTAAQVDGYLMEQAVMNFAGTAARNSALSSVQAAGMMAHVGGGTVTVYDGSAWQQVYPRGITLITSGTLSGASVVLSNIPSTYEDLRLAVRNFLPATDSTNLQLRINADSGANRYFSDITIGPASATAFNATSWTLGTNADNAVTQGFMDIFIPSYANATMWKTATSLTITNDATTTTSFRLCRAFGVYNQTAAITSLTMLPSSGNFTSGNYFLYGVA